MDSEYKELTIENINQGALKELFDEEVKRVLANINDLNYDREAPREIVAKVKIVPNGDELSAKTIVQVHSKLPPLTASKGSLHFHFQGNRPKAFIHDVRQQDMDFSEKQEQEEK